MSSEGSGPKLATAYYELIPSMAGAESQITAGIVPASAKAGAAAGESIGSMLLGGLKKYAGPIAAIAAGLSVKKIVEDSDAAFSNLASTTRQLQLVAGGTTEQVSGMAGAMQLAGINTDTIGNSIKIFSKNLGNASTSGSKTAAMSKLLGQNMLDAAGNVKPMADLLPGLADKFQSMPDGAQKTALAVQLFGRSGQQIIPFLNQGSAGLAQLTAQAKTAGLVISQSAETDWWQAQLATKAYAASVSGAKAALGEDLVPVMEAVSNVGRSIMTPVLNGMTSALNVLMPKFLSGASVIEAWATDAGGAVKNFMSGFSSGTIVFGTAQSKVAAFGNTVHGVFFAIEDIAKPVLSALKPMIAELAPVFASLIPQVLSLASAFSPVHLIFTALAPVLPQLIQVFAGLAATLAGGLGTALHAILPAVTSLAQLFTGSLSKVIIELIPIITSLAETIGVDLSTVLSQIAPVIGSIVKALGTTLGTVLKAVLPLISMLAGLFGQVLTAVMPLIEPLLGLIQPILSLITPLLQLVGPILKPLIDLFAALLKPILALLDPLINLLVPVITLIANLLAGWIGWIAQVIQAFVDLVTGSKKAPQEIMAAFQPVQDFFSGLIKGWISLLAGFGKNIVDFFSGIPKTINDALAGAGSWLVDIGKNMIQGLLNGAGSLLKTIGTFFLSVVPSWIVAPFKAALGIHSPSTVFAGLGGNITDGLMQGISAGQAAVKAQMQSLVTVPAINDCLAMNSVASLASAAANTFPSSITLVDQNGSILAQTKVIATNAVNAADQSSAAIVTGGQIR